MNTTQAPQTPLPSRWGRSRFGGDTSLLLVTSFVGGALVAAGIGGLAVLLNRPEEPWLLFGVTALVTSPVCFMLVWASLVDRSTLKGAVADPDESVESRWYAKAATGSFHVLIAALGLGAGAFSFVDVDVSPPLLLAGYFLIAVASFAILYLSAKKSEG